MSEEKKVEKKDETGAAKPVKVEEKKKKSGVLSLVAVVLGCFLLVAVVLLFLNGQKLNKQVVELQRRIVTLQTGEKEMGKRVLALEDEFVVMGLKHSLKKIAQSRKNLEDLKLLFADNPEMVDKLQALADDLVNEQKRLEDKISGTTPGTFKGSRLLKPVAFHGRCEGGKCFLAPAGQQPPCLRNNPLPIPASAHDPAHVSAGHHSVSTDEKNGSGDEVKQPQSGWSKFINMRLFGN